MMTTYEFCVDWIARASFPGAKVLDYGCGEGQIVAMLRQRGVDICGCDVFYGGGDYSPGLPEELKPYIFRMDGQRIPFSSGTFDLVVSNQVFEHVPDMEGAVREIARVLKPGGRTLNIFPDRGVWREGHCGVPFLHRFRKGAPSRVYFAAGVRALGMGYHKEDKSILQWAQEFCLWLDNWTYYRSMAEIHRHFSLIGPTVHLEHQWFDARLGGRFGYLPAALKRLIVRKLAGVTLVSTKALAPFKRTTVINTHE